jgi:hypothetical protein
VVLGNSITTMVVEARLARRRGGSQKMWVTLGVAENKVTSVFRSKASAGAVRRSQAS